MLAGMPILTAFKYYDVAKYVTDLQFSYILSVNLVNESWFKAQPKDVQDAIRAAGREAEQKAFPWVLDNNKKSYEIWLANKGEILKLPAAEQEHDDEGLCRPRHQDRRSQSGGEEGVRRPEEVGRRQDAEVSGDLCLLRLFPRKRESSPCGFGSPPLRGRTVR